MDKAVPRFIPTQRNKSINRLDRKRHDYHIGRKVITSYDNFSYHK